MGPYGSLVLRLHWTGGLFLAYVSCIIQTDNLKIANAFYWHMTYQ
jgi:hypothetical protein